MNAATNTFPRIKNETTIYPIIINSLNWNTQVIQ